MARALGLTLATACAAAGSLWMILDRLPNLQYTRVQIAKFAAFVPYGVLAWLLAAALFLSLGRRWFRLLALPCAVALAVQASWLTPYLPHAAPTASGSPLRLLSVNVNFGKADPDQLADRLRSERPDVVVLLEIQQPLLDALAADGVAADYPYSVGNVPPGWSAVGHESDEGTLVLSRTPVRELERLPTPNGQYVVSVERSGGPVTVIAARPRNVLLGMAGWRGDSAEVARAASAHPHEPLVVAGDFNAVREHATMRPLAALGLRDAAEESGAGWVPTYPSNDEALPPLITIDHILVGDKVTATALRSFPLFGTDHRGLVADLVVKP